MPRLLLLLTVAAVAHAANLPSPTPTARQVIDRALAAAEFDQAAKPALNYRFDHLYVKRKAASGEMREQRRDRYQVVPGDGEHRYELVETGGRAATRDDLAREEKLRRKFRSQMRTDDDHEHGRTGFEFDQELVDRYRFRLEGPGAVEGRKAWVVEFSPRSDDLPVDRRIDYALNQLTGRMYFDQEECRLVRVEFRLASQVKVWQGLLGSVRELDGRLEFARVEPGVWLPRRMTLNSSGRMLFESLDQEVEMVWSNFERAR